VLLRGVLPKSPITNKPLGAEEASNFSHPGKLLSRPEKRSEQGKALGEAFVAPLLIS